MAAGCTSGLGVVVYLMARTNRFSARRVPTLIIGPVTIAGGRGEIVLPAADTPAEGHVDGA